MLGGVRVWTRFTRLNHTDPCMIQAQTWIVICDVM